MHLLNYFFHWYSGQVWPNLLASAITTSVAAIIGYYKLKHLHNRHAEALHNHISQEFAKLKGDK